MGGTLFCSRWLWNVGFSPPSFSRFLVSIYAASSVNENEIMSGRFGISLAGVWASHDEKDFGLGNHAVVCCFWSGFFL
jgi:hypothetical protein